MNYFNKYKILLIIITINFPYFLYNFKIHLIPYILSCEYKRIENYLKICSSTSNFVYLKKPISNIPKISIISPVYNTGKFVLRLLRSIQNQNFNDIEIILIDDCSKDNSLELMKNYQSEDKRIKIIKNKRNIGTFASRIAGILKSNGNYILMPDSDDILLENSLKYLYLFSIKYDFELLRYNIYLNYGKTFFGDITNKLESKPIYQPILSTYLFYAFGYLKQVDFNVSNKFIKREALIRALNLFQKTELNMYMTAFEDGLLNYFLYRASKSFYFLKKFGYYYIKNNFFQKGYKKRYLFNLLKYKFIYLIHVFNYSKNTKYEKDMTNQLFKYLVYKTGENNDISPINIESNFIINIIRILNENEFFSYKYKVFLNSTIDIFLNKTKAIKII